MTDNIRHVQPGDYVSAEITSAPTRALEKRLVDLENKIRGITNNPSSDINFSAVGIGDNNFILKDKEAETDVRLYDVVYYNKNTSKYAKALASINTSGYTFNTDDSSFVVGVVTKLKNNTADILVNGILENLTDSQLKGMLQAGESFSKGSVYYLSSTQPGKITKNKPNLVITVLTTGENELFVSKNYTYAEGLESTGTFEVGMRPLGKTVVVENKPRLVGFPGLEYIGPHWRHTDENPELRNKGFIIADIQINEEPSSKNLWLQLELDDDGEVHLMLTEGIPDGFIWQNDEASNLIAESIATSLSTGNDNDEELDTITPGNYKEEQTCTLHDGVRDIGTITFKFTAPPGQRRLVIFKIPESFKGWREINTYDDGNNVYAITGSGKQSYSLDYQNFDRPTTTAHLYYNSKADFDWPILWPPQPLDNVAFLQNGIELLTSTLNKSGDASTFENNKYIVGVSDKTLYWSSSHRLTQPYDNAYEFFTLKSVNSNDVEEEAQFTHLPGMAADSYWHWWENILENESLLNSGKGYANKRNKYFASTRVMGLSAAGSIELTDLITGKKAEQGELLQGNVLITAASDQDHVSQVTANIDLKPSNPGSSDAVEIFKNETGGDVVVTNIILITTNYQGSILSLNRESTVEVALGTSGDVGSSQGLDQNIMPPTAVGISTSDGAAVISGSMMNSKIIRNGDKIWLSVVSASDSSIVTQTAKAIVKGVIV